MIMKRLVVSALTVAFCTALALGEANAQRRITPFAGGGLATGTDDLGDDTDSGWIAFVGADLPVGIRPGLSVGLTASYARVPYKGEFDESMGVPALFGELGYVFGAGSARTIQPYLRGGAGVQLRKYDPGTTGYREQSDGGLAFSAAGGVRFLFEPAAVFIGARFVGDSDAGVLGFHGGVAFPASTRSAPR
jgi:hypothetical protein